MTRASHKFEADTNTAAATKLGQLRGGAERATIYDVAALAGVSAITVSRALNGGTCSDKTRELVQKAVRKLDYRPNGAAQALAARKRKRTPSAAAPHTPRVWDSYADMMLRLMRPAA